jgi:hypothetical protein
VNLGLGFGEANKTKQKLEVVFRVLGFAQRCIDFQESFIVVLVGYSFLVCTKILVRGGGGGGGRERSVDIDEACTA